MSNRTDTVTAFAPASIGNVAVGFDMLGLAIAGAGDRVTARRIDGDSRIAAVLAPDGSTHPVLAPDIEANTAGVAALALWREHGAGGIELVVEKGIPLNSGMGSSAASAVAGAVAANGLLDEPLNMADLLPFALAGETLASGGMHADNVAPSLLGGLVLCPPVLAPALLHLPVPPGLASVLLHPDLAVNTAESRAGLKTAYSTSEWLTQQGLLAGFVHACHAGDAALLGRCLRDELIEPQRAAQVPCFEPVRDAALAAGALGCSLSGSGPSIFALCFEEQAEAVAATMRQACEGTGINGEVWVSPLDAPGARLEA